MSGSFVRQVIAPSNKLVQLLWYILGGAGKNT